METIDHKTNFVDPWQGKASRLKVISSMALFLLLILAIYDGVALYTRFQQHCMSSPNSAVCNNFGISSNQQVKPTLNLTLNYDNGRYAIQTGVFKSESNAQNNVLDLESNGIQARIIKIRRSKRTTLFKVQLGRFLDKKTATETAKLLKTKGILQDYVVASYVETK